MHSGREKVMKDGIRAHPEQWPAGKFIHPHDACFDAEGNIFIAECKFWKGPAKLTDTVEQLLSYTSWRDTKTAILVFVRDTALSTVLAKVPEVLKQHPAFKREIPIDGETRFRSMFGQPKDPSRELLVTTQVFNVPT